MPSPESNDRDNRRQKPGSRNLDQKFSDRHPGLVGIVFVEDDTSFKGRLRKHLRNPPMRTVFLIVVLVFVIPVAIAYSKVSNVAQEKWRDVQQAGYIRSLKGKQYECRKQTCPRNGSA